MIGLPDELNPLRMSELDIAAARLTGHTGELVPAIDGGAAPGPREVLERILRRLLDAGPCSLAFSGGRDSSALLAVAVHVARRGGLEAPAPVTVGYEAGVPSDERDWQRLLLDHLELDGWEEVDGSGGRMDFVGPVAKEVLGRHGLLHPPHTHMFAPMFERMPGATLITGIGGDELLGGWRLRGAAAALRGRRPTRHDVRELGLALAPRPLSRRAHIRMSRNHYPWLRPAPREEFVYRRAEEKAAEPALFDKRTRWWPGRRGPAAMRASFERVAAATGSRVAHPLMEPEFVAAVAAHYGPLGGRDRTAVWRDLFADVLPGALVERESKAPFTDILKNVHSWEFIRRWAGESTAPELIDRDGLVAAMEVPGERRPGVLVQALWLTEHVGRT